MRPQIRPATEADVGPMAELTAQLGYPVDAETLGERLADVRTRTADEVIVAVDEHDRPIAWVHVALLATLEASDLAAITGLVVDEGRRSGGIGGSLVDAAERWARDRGATAILVRSRSTRVRAHRFYERLGYVEVKRSHVFEKPLV
jgi:GNAT superfamily N-acetyltransferase